MTTLSNVGPVGYHAPMRLRRGLPLFAATLVVAGCATVVKPPQNGLPVAPPQTVSPPVSEVDQTAASYRSAADAPRILEALDHRLADKSQTAADFSTPDLATYSDLLLAAGRLPEAEQALSLLNERKPNDHTTLLSLALLAGARGDLKTQSRRVSALDAAFPGDADAADLKARLALAQGDKAGAKAAWQGLLTQKEDPAALQGLANLALGEKRFSEALSLLDRAVAVAPADDQAWALRAQTLASLAKYPEARRDLDRAISLAPEDPWHRLDRGKLLWLHLYDPLQAQADLEFATIQAPDNFFGWEALAEVYEDQLRPRQAYDAWMKALSLRPDYRFAYPSAAMLCFRFQDFQRAGYYAHEAAKDYPAEFAFPFVEALSFRAVGKIPAGQTVLEKARSRFTRGSTVDEFFRFLLTPSPGADATFNAVMNKESEEKVRVRLRFYLGCYYALTKSPSAAQASFEEVETSTLLKIPEVTEAKDWLEHGL